MKLNWGPWASVSEGRSTPGALVTAVPWGERFALFLTDPNGGVYGTGGDPQRGFGPWASVSEGRSTPGAPVTAVPWGEQFALFVADPNGGIYTTGGDPQRGFGPWASVSGGGSRPGAPVTAVPWRGQFALFVADPQGRIYTTLGDPQRGFGPWASVSEGRSMPGAPVTAVPWGGRFALFVADSNGWVYRASSQPPKPPTNLRVTDVTAHAVSVSWTDDADDQDGFRVSFRGKRQGHPDDPSRTISLGRAARSASLTNLLSGYDYSIWLVAFDDVGQSADSNHVLATTRIVPETVTVNLERQEIIEGNIPYLGKYSSTQPGHLLQIALPQSTEVLALSFVKVGHSTEECGDPTAVVSVNQGTSTTPEQIAAIYGVAKPQYSSQAPVVFVACITQSDLRTINSVPIEITIISDV
jgi:Fibronectin type III domain